MPAALRAFNAANINAVTTSTTSLSAPKPNGLAVGDIWLIEMCRRGTDAESAVPSGFAQLSTVTIGSNNAVHTFWKVADAADVAGGAAAWTADLSRIAHIQSFAISGANTNSPFSSDSPSNTVDGAAGTSHSVSGITPDADGFNLVFAANGQVATTWTAPTTQSGGWTEYSDNQMGSTNPTRVSQAVYTKSRTVAQGATGTITFASSASVQATTRVLHVKDAPPATPTLLYPPHHYRSSLYRR